MAGGTKRRLPASRALGAASGGAAAGGARTAGGKRVRGDGATTASTKKRRGPPARASWGAAGVEERRADSVNAVGARAQPEPLGLDDGNERPQREVSGLSAVTGTQALGTGDAGPASGVPWTSLPDTVLQKVFETLREEAGPFDANANMIAAGRVCRQWRSVAMSVFLGDTAGSPPSVRVRPQVLPTDTAIGACASGRAHGKQRGSRHKGRAGRRGAGRSGMARTMNAAPVHVADQVDAAAAGMQAAEADAALNAALIFGDDAELEVEMLREAGLLDDVGANLPELEGGAGPVPWPPPLADPAAGAGGDAPWLGLAPAATEDAPAPSNAAIDDGMQGYGTRHGNGHGTDTMEVDGPGTSGGVEAGEEVGAGARDPPSDADAQAPAQELTGARAADGGPQQRDSILRTVLGPLARLGGWFRRQE